MYAWVTEFPQVMNAGMVIYRYLKQTPFLLLLQEMLPQYLIFTSYVQLWRDSMQHGVLQHFRSSLTMSDIIRRLGIYSTRPTSWTFNAGPPPNALVYLRLTIGDEELAIDILNHDYELKKLHGLMESFTHELKQATVATGGVSLAELVAGTYRIAPEE
ncbi:hypothetical protein PsYK624_130130 [Phanerochaete sordida]|uniref:Uncharacterized protein n=1 Tax=Phanerochaete sordida TaxID=48140 RepID=A0A9P3LK23_9APHY|nr:hypothetical protein PsYK624_130130 [Phanerochaete sordida]